MSLIVRGLPDEAPIQIAAVIMKDVNYPNWVWIFEKGGIQPKPLSQFEYLSN